MTGLPQVPDLGGRTLDLETAVAVIVRLKRKLYPWMHVKKCADGTVVITLSPKPKGAA